MINPGFYYDGDKEFTPWYESYNEESKENLKWEVNKREKTLKKSFEDNKFDLKDKSDDYGEDEKNIQIRNESIEKNKKSITEKVNKNFEDKNNSGDILVKKPEVQEFFATIIFKQNKEFEKHKSKVEEAKKEKLKSGDENETDSIESWEEYKAHEASPENFEAFLLSSEWVRILRDEIADHIDDEWNFMDNYKISVKNLEVKLRKAWYENMRRNYNRKYNIVTSGESDKMQKMWQIISNSVDRTVSTYIKNWWDKFDDKLTEDLEKLLSNKENQELIKLLEPAKPGDEEGEEKDKFRDEFRRALKESIKKYSNIVCNGKKVSLDTGDTQVDLLLKSYLYLYRRFFYQDSVKPKKFKEKYLPKIMWAILINDGDLEDLEHNEFAERERQAEKERQEREAKRRQEIAERNRLRNSWWGSWHRLDSIIDKNEAYNVDNASWAQIAHREGLWPKLKDHEVNTRASEKENKIVKQVAFKKAWNTFINQHPDLKDLINIEDFSQLCGIDANTDLKNLRIRDDKWEEFKNNKVILFGKNPDEIRNILNSFSSEYINTIDDMYSRIDDDKDTVENSIRESAIWSVIDGVKSTLSSKWFKFNSKNPVKRHWNDIIISGEIEWSERTKWTMIKVRYDLDTGKLYMNSVIQKSNDNSKITLSNNSEINNDKINEEIWELPKFDDLLKNEYNLGWDNENNKWLPTRPWRLNREKLWNNMKNKINWLINKNVSLLTETIIDNSKRESTKMSTITKFMKSFNITSDTWWFSSLDFNKWSNLFDLIQIIDNTWDKKTGNLESLEYFDSEFMPTIMKYSWLKWWERNENQDKQNEYSEKLFKYKGNDDIGSLRDKIKDFNPDQFSWVADFREDQQLQLAEFIKKFTGSESAPNWKLDIGKMKNFVFDLKNTDDKALDAQLESA